VTSPKSNSSRKKAAKTKPEKPYPTFPLYAHACGQWAKKIKGKIHYFGTWDDWKASLELYNQYAPDLHAGRTPEPIGSTIGDVCNLFLHEKKKRVAKELLKHRSWQDYQKTALRIVNHFGRNKPVESLDMNRMFVSFRDHLETHFRTPGTLLSEIQRVKTILKWAYDFGHVDNPIRVGGMLEVPTKSEIRKHNNSKGERLFTPDQIITLLSDTTINLRAMILLGINCGFEPHDCGQLEIKRVDFENSIIDWPRPKTHVRRQCPLWPITRDTLAMALQTRKHDLYDSTNGLFFITKYRNPYWIDKSGRSAITSEFAKLTKRLNMPSGLTYIRLRHTFRTVADASEDKNAINWIMGHTTQHISEDYRQSIDRKRLDSISDLVYKWLFVKQTS